MTIRPFLAIPALLAAVACTGTPEPAARPVPGTPPPIRDDLPPIPFRAGELDIDVVYPPAGEVVPTDSNFIFGNVGTGRAELSINGHPVVVEPNGAFLAFLPVPEDGVYRLLAAAEGETATEAVRVRVPEGPTVVPPGELAIMPGSLVPRAVITGQEWEPVTVRLRGTPGAEARIVFPDSTVVPLVENRALLRGEGFMQDLAVPTREVTEYAGTFPIRAPLYPQDRRVGVPTLVQHRGRIGTARVELIADGDTVRAPLELALGVLPRGAVRVGVAAGDRPDSAVIGTALPGSGTPYHWSFPNGTRFAITGERDGHYRVRLTDDLSVWVDREAVRLLPPGAPPPQGYVGSVRVVPHPEYVDVRLATSERFPVQVDADDRWLTVSVFGAETRTNWLHYGFEDPLVRDVEWEQPRDDLYYLRLELAEPVWGWKTFWDERGNLVVRIRRPPELDVRNPLRGVRVGVDAGHPPGGAVGPTGYTEAEANLEIAKELVAMLRRAGAEVVEIRPDTGAVSLGVRPVIAEAENVDVLVSIHNNAFPAGVNPFENAGTSVFYNQPQSLGLARWMQREILGEFGLRDLGIARADLALVRPSWFPSVLTESMFLMIPQQEAALKRDDVQERIAAAHFRALQAFLRDRAR